MGSSGRSVCSDRFEFRARPVDWDKMSKFAANTTVSVEKSRSEIERTLERYGADQFSYGRDGTRGMSMIQFRANERVIRFVLTLPSRELEEFQYSSRGKRSDDTALKLWEQSCRQRWRALALCIKAKLEAVESDISEFEDEFLAHIVLPDGKTAGEFLRPQIEQAYSNGSMPSLLALPSPS